MTKSKKLPVILIIYTVCLFAVWATYTLLLKPVICGALGETTAISSLLRNGVIKNLVWTVPAAFLITKYKENCMVSLKGMFTKASKGWQTYLVIFPCFVVYILIGALRGGGISISESFGIDSIITVLFVGLTEELVFRGWLLNATIKEDDTPQRQYIAIALNALAFLCIHFPIWISKGEFVSSFTSLGFLSILVLSVLFSIVFIRTKNLILPIALHMFWDLLVFMLM